MSLTKFEVLPTDVLSRLEEMRRPGERIWLDTVRRVLVHQALERAGGVQKDAAEILGCSPKTLNYYAEDLVLRPKDRR